MVHTVTMFSFDTGILNHHQITFR